MKDVLTVKTIKDGMRASIPGFGSLDFTDYEDVNQWIDELHLDPGFLDLAGICFPCESSRCNLLSSRLIIWAGREQWVVTMCCGEDEEGFTGNTMGVPVMVISPLTAEMGTRAVHASDRFHLRRSDPKAYETLLKIVGDSCILPREIVFRDR
jgi:hypothetical protein